MVYCEQLHASAGFEPWNALTNAGFLCAAAVGWLAFRRAGLLRSAAPQSLVWLCAAIAIGSFAWHATGAPWAQWADVLPILGFVLVYLMAALTALGGHGWRGGSAACAVLVASAVALTLVAGRALNGSVAYVPVWFALLVLTLLLRRQRSPAYRAFALAVLLFAVSLIFRTMDLDLCRLSRVGTHWLWHLCNAVLLAHLMRTLARHHPARVNQPA